MSKPKPTYLSTDANAALLKLIDLAFDLAAQLDREHAERLGHLLQAMRHALPDNPRALGGKGDVDELLQSKVVRDLGIHSVNRRRKDQGKPTLSNMRPAKPTDRPTKSDVGRLDDMLRGYLIGRAAATADAPEPASEPIDDAPCRAFTELDSALLAAELDQWLADGGEDDDEDEDEGAGDDATR